MWAKAERLVLRLHCRCGLSELISGLSGGIESDGGWSVVCGLWRMEYGGCNVDLGAR